jgi:hypothetical protein
LQGVPEEDKSKAKEEEIEKRMTELFAKLDALSHLHFVPKEVIRFSLMCCIVPFPDCFRCVPR